MDFAPRLISESQSSGQPIAMAEIDIDDMKEINRTHGHAVGDDVLALIAKLIKSLTSPEDVVARFEGEQFIVMFRACDSKAVAQKCETIRAQIEALRPLDLPVSASIGVSQLSGEASETGFEQLYQAADRALMRAKAQGKNCVIQSA